MPSSRFEGLYEAFMKRSVAKELSDKRDREMAACWGNPNMDSAEDKELRSKVMTGIQDSYENAIAALYGGEIENPQNAKEAEIDEADPFWRAAKSSVESRKLQE